MGTVVHDRPPLTRGDVLSAAEAAALLGCSKRHVYQLVDRDQLPGARRLGRRVLIVRPVLEAWLLGSEDTASLIPRALPTENDPFGAPLGNGVIAVGLTCDLSGSRV